MPITRLTLVCFTAGLLAACSSAPKPGADTPLAASAVRTSPRATVPARPVARTTSAVPPVPEYLDPRSPISTARSVYFAFDDAAVAANSFGVVERQGRYLAANPMLKITVEGNTDERGSAEYNLALGQKRAEAVLRAMKVYGAVDAQMEAISWGREKPRAPGHDEVSWSENRRADVVYPHAESRR